MLIELGINMNKYAAMLLRSDRFNNNTQEGMAISQPCLNRRMILMRSIHFPSGGRVYREVFNRRRKALLGSLRTPTTVTLSLFIVVLG